MADSTYHAGTISVTAGDDAVTGTLTAFLSQVRPGDTLINGNGLGIVESVDSNTSLTLALPWNGDTLEDEADYRILRTGVGWHSVVEVNAQLAQIIAMLEGSPAFTGTPTAPTAEAGTNTQQLATTAFVAAAVTAAVSATFPTSSALPIGWSGAACRTSAGSTANGATSTGGNIVTTIWDDSEAGWADGAAQTGVWRNDSGKTLAQYDIGTWTRIS